jgi:LacI family transcriptional regulator
LKSLVLPVGVLAVHDYRARVLVDECVRLGLDVPHDVAVLGVGNDLAACEFCQPSLSSVSPAARRVGYEAAAILDRLMAGQPVPHRDLLIPPDGVVHRRSTDTMAVDDPNVNAAVHYMQDHLNEVFGIERVMKQVAVSRRRLHEQFQRLLDYTPYEYLCHLRVERAKSLLAVPGQVKLRTIAVACGFSSPARLRLVFQRVTGMTPAVYHRRHRGPASSKRSKRRKESG